MTILTEHMSSARCEPEQSEGADAPSQAEPQAKPGEGTASSKLKHWQTLAGLLIGYAQTLVRLERTNDARAWEVAEALEISTRSSLALCMTAILRLRRKRQMRLSDCTQLQAAYWHSATMSERSNAGSVAEAWRGASRMVLSPVH